MVTPSVAYYADNRVVCKRMQQRHLVLEDGTVFPGRAVGAAGRRRGRGLLHDRDRPATRRRSPIRAMRAQVLAFSLPARRQLRRRRAPAWSPSASGREGVVMRRARPAWSAWLAAQGVVALEEVDTRALVRRAARGRRDALRARRRRRPTSCASARSRSRTSTGERMLAEPELDLAARPRSRRARTSRTRSARARGSSSSTSAASARSCGGSSRPALEVVVVPGRPADADAMLAHEPGGGARRERAGRPGAAHRAGRDRARAARPGAALRHLPRPPARRRSRSGCGRSSCRSATAARTTPCASRGSSRVLVTVQNHGFAVEPGDGA